MILICLKVLYERSSQISRNSDCKSVKHKTLKVFPTVSLGWTNKSGDGNSKSLAHQVHPSFLSSCIAIDHCPWESFRSRIIGLDCWSLRVICCVSLSLGRSLVEAPAADWWGLAGGGGGGGHVSDSLSIDFRSCIWPENAWLMMELLLLLFHSTHICQQLNGDSTDFWAISWVRQKKRLDKEIGRRALQNRNAFRLFGFCNN